MSLTVLELLRIAVANLERGRSPGNEWLAAARAVIRAEDDPPRCAEHGTRLEPGAPWTNGEPWCRVCRKGDICPSCGDPLPCGRDLCAALAEYRSSGP